MACTCCLAHSQAPILMQAAEAAIRAAEEKAAQDEADRQKRIKDSFDAQMPDEISQKVQAALQKEMVRQFSFCSVFHCLPVPYTLHVAGATASHNVSTVC